MRPWKTAAGVLGLVLVIAVAPLASAQPAGVTNIDYIFSAHPDDEYQGYSRIDGVTDDYRVFVYMTRGEQSSYCRTASDPELHYAAYQEGQGPWGYQGPNAAVPQFDRGELEPRFNGLSPWGGQWTPGCVEARVQGTLLMLDALAAQDTGQPVTFDKRGRFYGGLYYNSSVVVPRRYDSHSNVDNPTGITNYVNVYLASNGRGAAVFFDLGDADLTQSEARWALDTTLARGGEWGFPALTRDDVMANYYNRSHPECFLYSENTPGGGGRDHGAVHRAVWDAMGASAMDGYGRTCHTDPDAQGFDNTVSTTRHTAAHAVSGSTRTGSFTRRYGWLAEGIFGLPSQSGQPYSQYQRFWRR